jgi:hypothetical protein
MMMTTEKAFVGTRPVASLHGRRTAEDVTETIATCATSSIPEMHVAGLKTCAKIRSVMSKNSMMKGL